MTDDRILEMIKIEAESQAQPDFTALMARINSCEAPAHEEAVAFPGEKRRSGYARIISAAAAFVLLCLSGLAVSGLFPKSASPMMSSEHSPVDNYGADAALSDSYESSDVFGNSAPNSVQEPYAAQDSSKIADGKLSGELAGNQNICTTSPAASGSGIFIRSAYNSHYLGELGMELTLPADAAVSGRDVDESFPLLGILGISASELQERMTERDIYFEAVLSDSDTQLTELVVRMSNDESTQAIYNLKWADEYQLGLIESQYVNYSESEGAISGASYRDVGMVETEQALFFCANGTINNGGIHANHLQYMTVVNGMKIEITLIEYLKSADVTEGESSAEVSDEHAALMYQLVQSVRFDKITGKLGLELGPLGVFFITISAVSALVLVGFFAARRLRRAAKKAKHAPDE